MENTQIKKKNNFECINGKSNKSKAEDNSKFLFITKNRNNKIKMV